MTAWWTVLLPAEEPTMTEVLGPYRTATSARSAADRWLAANPDDSEPIVLPMERY